jgi:hypothetical protein
MGSFPTEFFGSGFTPVLDLPGAWRVDARSQRSYEETEARIMHECIVKSRFPRPVLSISLVPLIHPVGGAPSWCLWIRESQVVESESLPSSLGSSVPGSCTWCFQMLTHVYGGKESDSPLGTISLHAFFHLTHLIKLSSPVVHLAQFRLMGLMPGCFLHSSPNPAFNQSLSPISST